MTFDPENVKRYIWESRGQGDPGSVVVLARDYNLLLELYKATVQKTDKSTLQELADYDKEIGI